MLLGTSFLYFDFHANLIYLAVLAVSICMNGGSFYSYKLKKLEALEVLERGKEEDEYRTFEERLYGEVDGNGTDDDDSDDDLEMKMERRSRDIKNGGKKQRYKATVIRSVATFTHASNDYGRDHRAKMASSNRGSSNNDGDDYDDDKDNGNNENKRVSVQPSDGRHHSRSHRHLGRTTKENATEHEVKFFAQQRRRDQQESSRPSVF